MITRENVIQLIRALKLPGIFLKVYNEKRLPATIEDSIGVPEEFFLMTEAEQYDFGRGNIYPLCDDGEFGMVIAYDMKRRGFIYFDTQDDIDLETLPVLTYQQVMVEPFLLFFEDVIDSFDEEFGPTKRHMKKLARLFDFKHIDALLAPLEAEDFAHTGGDWIRTFIDSIKE